MLCSVRYLGVVIDKMGNLQDHVRGQAALVKLRLSKLSPVLRLDSEVDLDTRLNILKMIAQPTAFYGKELANRGSEVARDRVRVLQRVLIRKCLGAPWFVPNRLLQKAAGVRDIVEVTEESKRGMVEAIRNYSDKWVRVIAELFENRGKGGLLYMFFVPFFNNPPGVFCFRWKQPTRKKASG